MMSNIAVKCATLRFGCKCFGTSCAEASSILERLSFCLWSPSWASMSVAHANSLPAALNVFTLCICTELYFGV